MVRLLKDDSGYPVHKILEAPQPETIPTVVTEQAENATVTLSQEELAQQIAASFTDLVLKNLEDADAVTVQQAPPPNNPIPSDLIHAQWIYSNVTCKSYPISGSKYVKDGSQTASLVVNYTFTVFLDNDNNPQGNFQYVLCQIDGEANPTNGTGQFIVMADLERAWFQDQVIVEIKPQDDNAFNWVANDPQTPNAVTTYTASSAFTVGFTSDGDAASYTWGNSTSYTISDWKVSSNSAGNDMSWNFRSGNSDVDKGHVVYFENVEHIADPNPLSLTQLQFHASAVWQTPSLNTRWETFLADGYLELLDVWAQTDTDGFVPASLSAKQLPLTNSLQINMDAVNPVPIQSLTFNPNPVKAGEAVTGTITLTKPAPIDIPIQLSSNSPNATVLPTVTVNQGETSADFQILTSSNGGRPGSTFVATITASYGLDSQAQLTLQN